MTLRTLITRVADGLIAPAFCATGFRLRSATFRDEIADHLEGLSVVVSGANSGLGFAIAEALSARGAEVTLACRDTARGAAARARLPRPDAARVVGVDISDLDSVAAAAARLGSGVDVLIHNAGALLDRAERTPQGYERTFATHVVGPYLLTRLCADRLARRSGRVVFVTSGGMYAKALDVGRLVSPDMPFDGVAAYARAKRAQVVLTRRLAAALAPQTLVAAMHPGWADTPGVESALPRFYHMTRPWLRTAAQGADTAVWLAAAPAASVQSGALYLDRVPRAERLWFTPSWPVDEERALIDVLESAAAPYS